jgi:hypothetical protein
MTRRAIVLALTVGLLLAPLFVRGASAQEQQAVARTIIGLYDSRREPEIRLTRIHKLIEMPLNHLGLRGLGHGGPRQGYTLRRPG